MMYELLRQDAKCIHLNKEYHVVSECVNTWLELLFLLFNDLNSFLVFSATNVKR